MKKTQINLTMSSIDKLRLLVWKNFLLQRRHKWQTLFEILSPVIFCIFLISTRCLLAPKSIPKTSYAPFFPTYFNVSSQNHENLTSANMALAYSPDNALTRVATKSVFSTIVDDNFGFFGSLLFGLSSLPEPIGYKNAKELEAVLTQPHAMNHILAGIQYDDDMANATSWPENIKVTLRFPATMRSPSLDHPLLTGWRTNLLFPLFPQSGPREPEDKFGGRSPGYSQEMFLAIQHAISQNIIKQKTGKSINTDVYLQRLPQLASREDMLLTILERFVSMTLMLGFAYTFVNTVRAVTTEKELQLKETMAIMGLPSWLHWVAWFIKQFSFLFVTVVIIVILYKIPFQHTATGDAFAVFTYTPWTVLLFLMVLFIIVSLAFSFMISVFFSKANTAASVMALIWFATFSVFMFTQLIHENVSYRTKFLLCLFSNSAIGYAFQMVIIAEGTSKGLQWADFFKQISYHEPFLPGHVVLMLLFDTVLYMAIAAYVEKIKPGIYGVPLPWYFPFTKSFWSPVKMVDVNEKKCVVDTDSEYNDALLKVVHDEEPKGVPIGVNMQITVLLGHNGAGKTTTISMLTGMVPPTSGSATINGYNIVSETELARRSVGICPQHNVLFPDLTVAEHIVFYAKLKGVPQNKIRAEVDHFIKVLELEEKRDALSSTLSGGQKRRLSVGCAMCGASRVVLLDEPTSGLDPAARRALWDLLQKEKRGRTMILTTHFMDEADVLADRIAIMAGGRLQCVGTPYFLKRHYGVGYKLTVVKDDGCPVDDVTRFFKSHVPKVKKNSNIGSELTYIFPFENVNQFPEMLQQFEEKRNVFRISSYGLSITSLEEVFMKAGAEDNSDIVELLKNGEKHDVVVPQNGNIHTFDIDDTIAVKEKKVRGFKLLRNHIKATFIKLAYNTIRNKGLAFTQLLWPVINIGLSMIVSASWKFLADLPPLELSLERGYQKTQTIISQAHNLTDGSLAARALIAYKDYFKTSTIPSMTLTDVGAMDIEKFYLKLSETEPSRVRYEALVGATFGRDNVTAWFSNYGYHDCATALALVDNAIMAALSPGTTLRIVNYPLPYSVENMIQIMATGASLGFMLSFSLGFCVGILSAFLILFVIKERTSGAKLLQRVSGLRPAVLWGAALAWDWLWMLILHLCVIATIACFQETSLSTFHELGRVFLVLLVFSFAIIPIHYLVSFFFDEASTGFSKMVFVNIFTGSMPFLLTEILRMPELGSESIAVIFDNIFSVLPLYSLSRSIREMIVSSIKMNACDSLCSQLDLENCTQLTVCHKLNLDICCIDDNPFLTWEEPGVARYLVTMVIVGVVAFSILLIKEYELLNKLMWMAPRRSELPAAVDDEDDDVAAERRVASELTAAEIATHSLVCRDLTKYYTQFLAVNRLTFAVRKGECFGLLGVNGAGKTSTFRMLTGDARISAGDAFVHGYSLRGHVRDVHRLIGYCPQFDALFDNLTGRETLRIFCLLRGIPAAVGAARALHLATTLGFIKHYDKKVHECSGGTKRKISTAVALLGDSPLIFLDEPTTGMDPASKRLVWACVNEAAVAGRSVVLTSHSMEECEALCSRLTIMVNGRLYCLGPLQHLKTKFSQGYTVVVKCKSGADRDAEVSKINNYIMENFSNAKLSETYLGISTYHLKDAELPWWRVFHVMEEARKQFAIEDYSVSQTTLEQVFLIETYLDISTYSLASKGLPWWRVFSIMERARTEYPIEDYSVSQTTLEQVFLRFTNSQIESKDYFKGMVPPTSGSVTINGYNIVSETELARRSVGICPQHNVLFPDLTVAEHIVFYAKLKGVPQNKIRAEVDHFIKVLELEEKRDAFSSTLSGGQKRRLSVGCAMCGASRVVLLDEPTSGLDPAARRALWDLLQKEKRGRTMILTTHFMDEADVLADRIAIMAGGRLQCVGTPYFLKRHYGVGYKLTVVKDDGCPVDDVTRFFKSHLMWMAPRRSELPAAVDDEDDDVAAERRVASELTAAEIATHSLVCRDLTKYYKQFLAVNRLTFAVRKGECFGLLGVNGAGKTSTFRMLTGDARISAGDAFVQGYSLRGHVRDVHRLIGECTALHCTQSVHCTDLLTDHAPTAAGYCPQFDALFDNLTGRETLRIFCLLRGIPAAVGAARALQLATTLGFIKHYDKKVHECSGGTKRKISTAIALLGDSPLIFLDEPTTGYTLIVKCSSGPQKGENVINIDKYITENFTGARLIESYLGVSTYYLKSTELPWWQVFYVMEKARKLHPIGDYSVSETTLEQVFLRFTKSQISAE
ncbi:hypothetical protein O3G_MSEX004759 [Manduca sexta]|uniref:ABC transporter domain-containing protein n=1 Tax=Manduca sexta TaxID=7130 RepID=A0A921YXE3_MANSE|nr:hypothetical protein O3G_MSEX004759 [Manduca sexta]